MTDRGMKKIVLLSYIFILSLLYGSASYAQENNNYPFASGEKLSFILNYTWGGVITDVGMAECNLSYSDGYYNCVVTGRTYRFYDMFFRVREHFESKFSEKGLRPLHFYRSAQEGKYRMKNNLVFNSDYSINSTTQKYDRQPFDTLLIGTENSYDLLSLFYKSRVTDYSNFPIDKKMPLEFVIDRNVYNLYFVYKGKETKKIPGLGTFRTLKFACKVVAGEIFDGKEELMIWVTDDGNKIPLLFESPIIVGKVQGRLSKFSGNKHPVSSKIK